MPIANASSLSKSGPLKVALVSGAAVLTVATLVTLVFDPTKSAQNQLSAFDDLHAPARLGTSSTPGMDVSHLSNAPIFVMTSGPSAYKERTFQLFGISISDRRKAVLVSIDGAPATWVSMGDISGDVTLSAVGTNGATFDTPVGPKSVSLSDAAPGAPASMSPQPNIATPTNNLAQMPGQMSHQPGYSQAGIAGSPRR